MDFFETDHARKPLRGERPPRRRPPPSFKAAVVVGLACAAAALFWRATRGRPERRLPERGPSIVGGGEAPAAHRRATPLCFTSPTPTPLRQLADTHTPGTFMPTASGRIESALFGLVRISSRGGPAFHEGIDIAPQSRDRQGRPADTVNAVADGTVGYVNRVAGNSNYGLYVVLIHDEPVGEFYTLYAHLSAIHTNICPGAGIQAGEALGRMGHTPSDILTPERGHLHFEVGLVQNSRFDRWYRGQGLTPDHGIFNGQNLLGIDPQALFRACADSGRFRLLDHLRSTPPAFRLRLKAAQPIDFFIRHPSLWIGESFHPGTVVLSVAESGIPVAGKMALPAELADEDSAGNPMVVDVSPDANLPARRLLARTPAGDWRLSASGVKWLEVLLY